MARRKTARPSAAARGLNWMPKQRKRISVGGVLMFLLLGLPPLVFGNLICVSAIGSAAIGQWQRFAGSEVHGVLTDTGVRTTRGQRGPDEHYCFAYFTSDDGRYVDHRVRVYADASECYALRGAPARLVRGAAQGLSVLITADNDGRLSEPMAFDGLYGMTDGASVGDARAFLVGLWPYGFIVPLTLLADVVLVHWMRDRWFRPRRRRRQPRAQEAP